MLWCMFGLCVRDCVCLTSFAACWQATSDKMLTFFDSIKNRQIMSFLSMHASMHHSPSRYIDNMHIPRNIHDKQMLSRPFKNPTWFKNLHTQNCTAFVFEICDNAAKLIALGEAVKCRHTQTDANQRDHQGVTVYRFSSEDLFVREQEEHTASITMVLIWLPFTPIQ